MISEFQLVQRLRLKLENEGYHVPEFLLHVWNITEDRRRYEEYQRALNILCWKSYAGCCAPEAGCPWNVAVSDALGVDNLINS